MLNRRAILLAAIAITLSAIAPALAADAPLTDEDIVRLFVQGQSKAELVKTIGSSDVDFDLSEEMLEELRIAGIPAVVLEAMRKRQAEMEPEQEPTQSAPDPAQPTVP